MFQRISKIYTCRYTYCDMSNKRKRYYKVMNHDVQVADIEIVRNENPVIIIILKTNLSGDIYHDIMNILSEVTHDHEFDCVCLSFLGKKINITQDEHDRIHINGYASDIVKEFPKYRRHKQYGEFYRVVALETHLPFSIKKHLIGKFILFEMNNRTVLLNEDTYKKLLSFNKNIDAPSDTHVIPFPVYGGEIISLNQSSIGFSCSDIHQLETMKFTLKSSKLIPEPPVNPGIIHFSNMFGFELNIYVDDELFLNTDTKIKLPDVSEIKHFIFIYFFSSKTGKFLNISLDMFDTSLYRDVVIHDNNKIIINNV